MKSKKILSKLFTKNRKSDWKKKHSVGRGTYGEPKIEHWGEKSKLKVGNFCSISGEVKILLGGNHRTDWITTYPFSKLRDSAKHIHGHPATRGDVVIGHDVWIGLGAVILSGVNIGNGAVIGASAMVTKNVPAYSIVVGNPGEIIGTRFNAEEINILEELCWWFWNDEKLDASMNFLLNQDILSLKSFSEEYDLKLNRK